MEVYNEVENDAPDAYDAYDAPAGTTKGHHDLQMVRHVEEEEEADRNQLIDMGVFKPTSGNAAKRLRMRQETREETRNGKTVEATLQQIASQEFQAEKGKMQIWKQMIMREVAHELQAIKESAEAREKRFQVEIEIVREQLHEMEVKSARLESEIALFQAKEQESSQQLSKKTAAKGKNQVQPTEQRKGFENSAPPIGEKIHPAQNPRSENVTPTPHSSAKNTPKRNYASVAAAKPAQAPEHPWTQVVHKNRKQQATKPNVKIEDQGRRILFPRSLGQQKAEADLMLALNEALQKAGEGLDTRFIRVKYAPSGAISALLTEQANAGSLIPRLSNLLIRTIKAVDPAVVGVEILEHWQRLKVHGMPLGRYLSEGKMELLKREVESSTGIQLKALPRWLINEDRLREAQTTGNKRGSAIVITVKGEVEAKKLCAAGLRFGSIIRVVEKYWEAGPSSVCMTCCGIGHERMGSCGNRPAKCVICSGAHKVEEHQCGVIGCTKGRGKICPHVKAQCANCGGGHMANSSRCISRQKAGIKANKERRVRKESEKEKAKDVSEDGDKVGADTPNPDLDMRINNGKEKSAQEQEEENLDLVMENDDWAASPTSSMPKFSFDISDESRDHTPDYA